jgi:hypothetical protein
MTDEEYREEWGDLPDSDIELLRWALHDEEN